MTRTTVRYLLGGLWLLDGFLKLQPSLWTVRMVAGTTQSVAGTAVDRLPWLTNLLVWASQIEARHVVLLTSVVAGIELVLGLLLITGWWLRAALTLSCLWALAIWAVGEGFGGLSTGSALMLTGAPGAALLYAVLALMVFPRRGSGASTEPASAGGWLVSRKGLHFANAGLWFLAALLQLQPSVSGSLGIWRLYAGTGMMGGGILDGQPRPIAASLSWFVSFALEHSLSLVLTMVIVQWLIGIGILVTRRASAVYVVIAVGAAWSLLLWWLGGAFGSLFSGLATDVGAAPVSILLLLTLWPASSQPVALPAMLRPNIGLPLVGLAALAASILTISALSPPRNLEQLLSRAPDVALVARHDGPLLTTVGIAPSQASSGRVIVHLLDPAPINVAGVSLRLVPPRPASSWRSIALVKRGSGNYVAVLPPMTGHGAWNVDMTITHRGHVVARPRFWITLPLSSADTLIAASDQAMNRLRSAAVNQVTVEDGRATRSRYVFEVPDIEFATDALGNQSYVRGDVEYLRGHGSPWRLVSYGDQPLRWPDQHLALQALNPAIVGSGYAGRVRCDIVSFWAPDSETTYRVWIGVQDHLVHRELIEEPENAQTLTFSRFNQPLRVPAP